MGEQPVLPPKRLDPWPSNQRQPDATLPNSTQTGVAMPLTEASVGFDSTPITGTNVVPAAVTLESALGTICRGRFLVGSSKSDSHRGDRTS